MLLVLGPHFTLRQSPPAPCCEAAYSLAISFSLLHPVTVRHFHGSALGTPSFLSGALELEVHSLPKPKRYFSRLKTVEPCSDNCSPWRSLGFWILEISFSLHPFPLFFSVVSCVSTPQQIHPAEAQLFTASPK